MLVAMVMASFAALSARSLPGIAEWPNPLSQDRRRNGVNAIVNGRDSRV